MLNQTEFRTVSAGTRKIILVDEKNSTAVSCKVANTGIDADSDGRKIAKAGTPLYGSLEARDNPFVKTGISIDPVANVTYNSESLTDVTVTAATFSTKVSGESGTYKFVYDADAEAGTPNPSWKLNAESVDLTEYGIVVTGDPDDEDEITVVFTAGGTTGATAILLHDVDVTTGTKNAQVVIFGTIDLNKLESDVQGLITSDVKSALKMIQFIR